jgi:hypothetical protein
VGEPRVGGLQHFARLCQTYGGWMVWHCCATYSKTVRWPAGSRWSLHSAPRAPCCSTGGKRRSRDAGNFPRHSQAVSGNRPPPRSTDRAAAVARRARGQARAGGAGAARSARRPVAARSGCMLSGAEDRCPPNGACRLRGVDHRAQTLPGRRAPAAAHDRAEAVVRSDQDQSAGGPGPPRPWSAIAFGATCPSIRLPTRAVARSAASLARVRFQRTSRRAPAGGGAWTSQSVASTRLMRLS